VIDAGRRLLYSDGLVERTTRGARCTGRENGSVLAARCHSVISCRGSTASADPLRAGGRHHALVLRRAARRARRSSSKARPVTRRGDDRVARGDGIG